jgi:hypothetical protein
MTNRDTRAGLGVIGVGAAACAACCAGPIVGFLTAIGLASVDEPGAEAVEHDEANETAEGTGVEGSHEGANAAAEAERDEGDERVLGVDLESPLFVAGGVVLSLLLAGFVWRRPDRRLLIAIAACAAVFAVLDIGELTHQLDEDRTGLAALATVFALLHAGIGGLATQQALTQPSAHQEPAPT